MIDNKFLQRIGLNEDQITLLSDAMRRENRFRELLGQEHVSHIEAVMKLTDLNEVDFSNEELLREKIRVEYDDMIPAVFKRKCQK